VTDYSGGPTSFPLVSGPVLPGGLRRTQLPARWRVRCAG